MHSRESAAGRKENRWLEISFFKKMLLNADFLKFQVSGQQLSPSRKKRRSTGRSGDGFASSPSNDSDNSVPGIKRDKLYCICKQKYDATKFYVGCDICSNWFHGSCVNITPRMSKKMSE